jgi:rhodanese-related sulfurtransferase
MLKSLFGLGPKADYNELMHRGAVIIDVRTKSEFQGGHIKGAVNIPLNNLQNHISKLDKNKPVITCCASGGRSAAALSVLRSGGFKEVYNGGGWMSLQSELNSK